MTESNVTLFLMIHLMSDEFCDWNTWYREFVFADKNVTYMYIIWTREINSKIFWMVDYDGELGWTDFRLDNNIRLKFKNKQDALKFCAEHWIEHI